MANVLDKLMLKTEADSAEQDSGRKAYSNMMVYLKELKNHNLKNGELAQQIFMMSEDSVEKLNEMRIMIAENEDNDTEKLLELLGQTEKLQLQMSEMAQLQGNIQSMEAKLDGISKAQNGIQNMQVKLDGISKEQSKIKDLEIKMEEVANLSANLEGMEERICEKIRESTADHLSPSAYEQMVQGVVEKSQILVNENMDTGMRGVKREINAMNDSLEGSVQAQVAELEEGMDRMKKTTTIYMRILTWAMAVVIVMLVVLLLPI